MAIITGVRSLADNQEAVALAVERFGKLDILIGNAGIIDMPAMLVTYRWTSSTRRLTK